MEKLKALIKTKFEAADKANPNQTEDEVLALITEAFTEAGWTPPPSPWVAHDLPEDFQYEGQV